MATSVSFPAKLDLNVSMAEKTIKPERASLERLLSELRLCLPDTAKKLYAEQKKRQGAANKAAKALYVKQAKEKNELRRKHEEAVEALIARHNSDPGMIRITKLISIEQTKRAKITERYNARCRAARQRLLLEGATPAVIEVIRKLVAEAN